MRKPTPTRRDFLQKSMAILAAAPAVPALLKTMAMAEPAPTGGFTDITKESGIADIVAQQYQTMDKVLADRHYEPNRWWLSGLTLIDLDGTGKLDLHIAGHGMEAALCMNDGKGRFTAVPRKFDNYGKSKDALPVPGGEIRGVYDLMEAGRQDLLISYHDDGGVTYLNQCKPNDPASVSFLPYDSGFNAFSRFMGFADLDRDGNVDYFMTADEGRARKMDPVHVYLGKGNGKWEKANTDISTLKEAGGLPCDINGDGIIDLLASQRGYNPQARLILLGDGKLNFRDATKECGLEPTGSIFGAGDLNQDGYPDLICGDVSADGKSLELALYMNDGKGHFTRSTEPILNFEGQHLRAGIANGGVAIVVDFDNDGIPDILISQKSTTYILRGLGGGKFEYVNKAWNFPANANCGDLCFGDINGDGMLDLIGFGPGPAADLHGAVVLRNDLPKKNWINMQPIGGKGHRSAANSIIRLTDPADGKLLAYEQICIWGAQGCHSYYFAANTERHFGLGSRDSVDITVEFYPSGRKVHRKGAKANQTLIISEENNPVDPATRG